MKNKFFKFTYRAGKPVRDYGKVVLLDKHRRWDLWEGAEYIIEDPVIKELEKCIIITGGSFLRVDDILPTYRVCGGPYFDTEKETVRFSVRQEVVWRNETISSEYEPNEKFTFGMTGGEEFIGLLSDTAQQQVADFRSYMGWIRDNQLAVLSVGYDFSARRGFRLQSSTESLKVETSGSGSPENPKEVSVAKLQTLVYQPVYQEGFEPVTAEGTKEVTNTLARLSLDESGLPFSFRSIWKSPTMMVGKLTINSEEIEGLVKCPGDGTGSYLDAVMYLGLMELPPTNLPNEDLAWLDAGGRICWVYEFSYVLNNTLTGAQTLTSQPSDPTNWFKIKAVYGGDVRYIQDNFDNSDYLKLVEELRPVPVIPVEPVVEETVEIKTVEIQEMQESTDLLKDETSSEIQESEQYDENSPIVEALRKAGLLKK